MRNEIGEVERHIPNNKIETEHFIIKYNEVDKSCIEDVLNVLEESYNRITIKLNQQLEEKVIVEIQANLNELHAALGIQGGPDWIRGGLGDGKIIIASPLNPPPGSRFNNVVNTAVHEFVHTLIKEINIDIPRWLDEGIASYEAKDNSEGWIIETVKDGLESNTIPTFNDLDTGGDFDGFFKKDGYQYSYTIVEAIVNIFGYEKLYKLIKFPYEYKRIFGITESELQNKWVGYIRANY